MSSSHTSTINLDQKTAAGRFSSHTPSITTTSSSSSTYHYSTLLSPSQVSIDSGDGSNGSSRLILKSKNLLPKYSANLSNKEKWLDGTSISADSFASTTELTFPTPTTTTFDVSPLHPSPLRSNSFSNFFSAPIVPTSENSTSSRRSQSFSQSPETLRNQSRAMRYRETLYYSTEEESIVEDDLDESNMVDEQMESNENQVDNVRKGRTSARIFILPSYSPIDRMAKKNQGVRMRRNRKGDVVSCKCGRRGSSDWMEYKLKEVWDFLRQPNRIQ